MTDDRRFPILDDMELTSIPWSVVEPFRTSCKYVHEQTLERLAERGGLSLMELYAHLTAKSFKDVLFIVTRKPQPDISTLRAFARARGAT